MHTSKAQCCYEKSKSKRKPETPNVDSRKGNKEIHSVRSWEWGVDLRVEAVDTSLHLGGHGAFLKLQLS